MTGGSTARKNGSKAAKVSGGNASDQQSNANRNRRATRSRKNTANAQPTPTAVAKEGLQVVNASLQHGCDRIAHLEGPALTDVGDVVLDVVITPATFPRLARLSTLYRRIQWLSVRFEIHSLVSDGGSGGYVAAVIRDADLKVPTSNTTTFLLGQAGAVMRRWTQSAELSLGKDGILYYTAGGGERGLRDMSPGRLVIAVEGTGLASGGLTVTAHWRVQFSQLSLGEDGSAAPHVVALHSSAQFWYWGNDTESTYPVALVADGKTSTSEAVYMSTVSLGLEPGTCWQVEPYTFLAMGTASDYPVAVSTQYLIAFDVGASEGQVRPAVLAGDGVIYDANVNWPGFEWSSGYKPAITGVHFRKGERWTEVDGYGVPTNTLAFTVRQRVELTPWMYELGHDGRPSLGAIPYHPWRKIHPPADTWMVVDPTSAQPWPRGQFIFPPREYFPGFVVKRGGSDYKVPPQRYLYYDTNAEYKVRDGRIVAWRDVSRGPRNQGSFAFVDTSQEPDDLEKESAKDTGIKLLGLWIGAMPAFDDNGHAVTPSHGGPLAGDVKAANASLRYDANIAGTPARDGWRESDDEYVPTQGLPAFNAYKFVGLRRALSGLPARSESKSGARSPARELEGSDELQNSASASAGVAERKPAPY